MFTKVLLRHRTSSPESEESRNMLKGKRGKSSLPSSIPLLGTFNRDTIKGDFFGVHCLWLQSLRAIDGFQSNYAMFWPWQNCKYTGKSFSPALEGTSIKSMLCYVTMCVLGLCASTDTWVTGPNSFQPGRAEMRWQHWCDCSTRLLSQLVLSLVAPHFAMAGGGYFFLYSSTLKQFLYFAPHPSLNPMRCICSVSLISK